MAVALVVGCVVVGAVGAVVGTGAGGAVGASSVGLFSALAAAERRASLSARGYIHW